MDNDNYYKDLGKKLYLIREKLGLTQKKVADAMGITFQQYQKYENGSNRIPTKSLVIFCKLTRCDVRDLVGMSVKDYELAYKKHVVNNYNTTYVHNFNGLFSNLFNMDLNIMKNRIVVAAVVIGLLIYFVVDILKRFEVINTVYNSTLLSFQFLVFMIVLTVIMFLVYSYSLLTYIITYIVYIGIIATLYRVLFNNTQLLNKFPYSLLLDAVGIALVAITFFILKKLKVNVTQQK